jgi:hypothetical protein
VMVHYELSGRSEAVAYARSNSAKERNASRSLWERHSANDGAIVEDFSVCLRQTWARNNSDNDAAREEQ